MQNFKFDDFRFSCSKHVIGASEFKVGHVILTLVLRVICILMLGLDNVDIAYIHSKFDHSSFSRSGDMAGAHKFHWFT